MAKHGDDKVAAAYKELYGDKVQVTFGPVIENGFYYDFYREEPFTPDDLAKLVFDPAVRGKTDRFTHLYRRR